MAGREEGVVCDCGVTPLAGVYPCWWVVGGCGSASKPSRQQGSTALLEGGFEDEDEVAFCCQNTWRDKEVKKECV